MFNFDKTHPIPLVHLTVRPKAEKGKKEDISLLISSRLMSLTLTDNRGFEADQLDIQLDDSDGKLALPARGALLSLGMGWKGAPMIFKGEYTGDEVEHSGAPDSITIRARSADLRGSLKNHFERSFHHTTLGQIVRQIAQENQLTAQISESLAQIEISHLDQTNESSLNLLQRLAEAYDAIAGVKNHYLLFMKAGEAKTVNGKPIPPLMITRQSGDSHHFSIAESENYDGVKVYWHDNNTGKRGEVLWDKHSQRVQIKKATMRKVTRARRNQQGELIKGENGKSIKDTRYQAGKGRMINDVKGTQIKSDAESIKTLPHTYASRSYAIQLAEKTFRKLKRGTAKFSLNLALGNAELIPEMPVEVSGFKTEIDGSLWLITRVTHNITPENGFTSQIECELMLEEMNEKA